MHVKNHNIRISEALVSEEMRNRIKWDTCGKGWEALAKGLWSSVIRLRSVTHQASLITHHSLRGNRV